MIALCRRAPIDGLLPKLHQMALCAFTCWIMTEMTPNCRSRNDFMMAGAWMIEPMRARAHLMDDDRNDPNALLCNIDPLPSVVDDCTLCTRAHLMDDDTQNGRFRNGFMMAPLRVDDSLCALAPIWLMMTKITTNAPFSQWFHDDPIVVGVLMIALCARAPT